MRRILRFVSWMLFAFAVLGAGIAMVGNRIPVALHFLDWVTPELPVYWWLVASFALGCLVGAAVSGMGLLRARASARRARGELDKVRSAVVAVDRQSSAGAPG